MSDDPSLPGSGRRLGSTAVTVGPVGYGCWRFAGTSVSEASAKIHAALDAGMTLVDTADIYGYDGVSGFGDAESLLGEVLAAEPGLREAMVLATKGGIRPGVPYDQSPGYLRAACEASLRRLGVDVIDLYQIHRPDLLAHPADVAETLVALRDEGKVSMVGVSNMTTAQVAALAHWLPDDLPLTTTQPEFHPLHLDPLVDGTFDQAMAARITPITWSPLGGGRLAGPTDGRLARSTDGARVEAVAAVCDRLAGERGVSRAVILLAWQLAHPAGIVPIVGTQRVERIAELARAATVELERAEWYEVLVAGRGEPLP